MADVSDAERTPGSARASSRTRVRNRAASASRVTRLTRTDRDFGHLGGPEAGAGDELVAKRLNGEDRDRQQHQRQRDLCGDQHRSRRSAGGGPCRRGRFDLGWSLRSTRVVCSAGPRPTSSALAMATAMLNHSVRWSSSNDRVHEESVGYWILTQQDDAEPAATTRPPTPPAIAIPRLSVSSWRIEPRAAGADGQPKRHFARAHRRAAGEQPRDVGAGDTPARRSRARPAPDERGVERPLLELLELRLRDQRLMRRFVSGYARSRSAPIVASSARASAMRHPGPQAAFQRQNPDVARLEHVAALGESATRGSIASGRNSESRTYGVRGP